MAESMLGKIVSLPIQSINFSDELEEDGLKKVTLRVCKAGAVISHGLFIESDSIVNAQEGIKNKPILCAYEVDDDNNKTDFQGHEMEYLLIKNGNKYELKINYIEQPVGVIHESCNARFETIDNEEWFVVDGYLYSIYCEDAVRILEEADNEKCVSMEIKVVNGEDNSSDKLFHITEFKFKGVTLLGESHNPAIQGANCTTFSQNDTFALQFSELLERVNKIEFEKGGKTMKRKEIIERFSNLKGNENYETIINNFELKDEELESQLFSLSINDLERRIREELYKITCVHTDYWGDTYETKKYWLCDVLFEENIVIVEDNECYYKNFGIPYSLDGDAVVLDLENTKRYVRGDWRLYIEGSAETVTNTIFEEIKEHDITKVKEVSENFEKIKGELDTTKSDYVTLESTKVTIEKELEELKEFKSNFEKEKKEKEVNELVERFSELSAIEGIEQILDKKFELEIDDLETKLKVFAFDNGIILGSKSQKKPKESQIIKTPITHEHDENLSEAEKRYGIDIKKYLND